MTHDVNPRASALPLLLDVAATSAKPASWMFAPRLFAKNVSEAIELQCNRNVGPLGTSSFTTPKIGVAPTDALVWRVEAWSLVSWMDDIALAF
jgi:hypothetical protein